MTIDGFWKKINECGVPDERLPLRIYARDFYQEHGRFLRVGIDVYMWIFESVIREGTRESDGLSRLTEPQIKLSLKILMSRIRYLIKLNISFVFVFDGVNKIEKRRWEGYQDSLTDEHDYGEDYKNMNENMVKLANNAHTGGIRHDCELISKFKQLLRWWNISYAEASGDAEIELARLNSLGVIDAVISNDADGFVYGAKVILRNYSRWLEDKPANATDYTQNKSLNELYVTPVRSSVLESKLGLTKERILFLACLCGNDVTSGVSTWGIEKALSLAQKGSSVDDREFEIVDFVDSLNNIYTCDDEVEYMKGEVHRGYKVRRRCLKKLDRCMGTELTQRTKAYFSKNYNCAGLHLPPDQVFMAHYFPVFTPPVFCFNKFDTNFMDFELNEDLVLSPLPQPTSIKDKISANGSVSYVLKRGNAINLSTGESIFEGRILYNENGKRLVKNFSLKETTIENRFEDPDSPMDWFSIPDFERIAQLNIPGLKNKSFKDSLIDELSQCYIARAIYNLDNFTEKTHLVESHDKAKYKSISITKKKELGLPSKKADVPAADYTPKWTETVYMVKFYSENIFGRVLGQKSYTLDEDMNTVEPKQVSVWIPEYILRCHKDGVSLIEEFESAEAEKASRKSTPKSSPRKRRGSVQKTTLASLSKSPIKLSASAQTTPLSSPSKRRKSANSTPSSQRKNSLDGLDGLGPPLPKLNFNSAKKRTITERSPAPHTLDLFLSPKKSRTKKVEQHDKMESFTCSSPRLKLEAAAKESGHPKV
ncbi:unnamed protein product [Ambrosiozyma monospora]|uniref:Unnamed protein product n=1 Tax=Ambrosiozyma monospora TaxID=43982 RepID=A0ACB5T5G0_AMBMO|nr:unnamed protein product [Ambrosiozyma monospora]